MIFKRTIFTFINKYGNYILKISLGERKPYSCVHAYQKEMHFITKIFGILINFQTFTINNIIFF